MSRHRSQRYLDYLKSPEFREKRDAVMCRAYYRCEVGNCGAPALEVHHLTYERLYHEELTDLIAVCRDCHDVLTDTGFSVRLRCLSPGTKDCACPVCSYRRAAEWMRFRLRDRLSREINKELHMELLRVYGKDPVTAKHYAGVARDCVPASLLCKRTGLAAGTEYCTCDVCLHVAAMEQTFREEEEEPDDSVC